MEANIKKILREDKIIVSATEPTGSNRKKVWLQHSNNIVNKSLAVDNRYVWFDNGSEQISSNNNYWSTGKLKIKSNTTYYFDKNINFIVYYDNLGIATRLETDKTSFTTDTNEYYVQLSFAKAKIAYNSDIMISTIENALYEPYVEPKIYVLNDNNIYEEFVPKEQNNYSTEEQVIGTYLGKPLYRKVITGNFSNGNTLLSNVDKFVSFSGNCKFTGDTWERSLPYGDKALSFVNIQKQAESTNVIIAIMVGGSSSSIIDSEIVLEYTKTTD